MLSASVRNPISSYASHEFGLGVALAVPGSHEQNFVAKRVSEYVVDIGRAFDFKETRAAGVCPVHASVEQKTQLGELLRRVFSEVFNLLQVSHLPYLILRKQHLAVASYFVLRQSP